MSDINTTPDNAVPVDETRDAQRSAVGRLLRDTRLAQGLDIADVARALRISQRYLESLESAHDENLPGPTYAIGFVRSYGEHLGLDGEEIVRRYKGGTDAVEAQADLVFPKPISDGGVPGAVVLGLGLVIAAVAYGVWYWHSSANTLRVAQVDPVPQYLSGPAAPPPLQSPKTVPPEKALASPAPEKAGVPVVKTLQNPPKALGSTSLKPQTPPDGGAATTSQGPLPAAETSPSAAEIALVDETPPAARSAKAVSGGVASRKPSGDVVSAVHPSRITVRAKANSWIQVRDVAANRLLFTRLLRQGDSYKVPDRADLRLMTGNAGALEIIVDGKVVPPLGAVGEVRRDVALDPDKLKAGVTGAH